jgi:hypothetical protein
VLTVADGDAEEYVSTIDLLSARHRGRTTEGEREATRQRCILVDVRARTIRVHV